MPQTQPQPLLLKYLILACAAALLLCTWPAMAEEAPAPDEAPAAMVTPWGAAANTEGDYCWNVWPDWAVAAFKLGGTWDAEAPAWLSTPGEFNALCLELDREALSRDLALVLWFTGGPAIVDLYDEQGGLVAADLAGLPMESGDSLSCLVYPLDLIANPAAVGVLLRNTADIKVRATVLFECADSTALRTTPGRESDLAGSARAIATPGAERVNVPADNEAAQVSGNPAGVSGGAAASPSGAAGSGTQTRRGSGGLLVRSPASGSRILW